MPTLHLLWDASASAKRYAPETGSEVVDALFSLSLSRSVITLAGYAETFAILLRKQNAGVISEATFLAGIGTLEADFFAPDAVLLSITDSMVLSSLALIRKHNLNSSDAAILQSFLEFSLTTESEKLLVSADKRLLRAAQSEGLPTFNPEMSTAGEITYR